MLISDLIKQLQPYKDKNLETIQQWCKHGEEQKIVLNDIEEIRIHENPYNNKINIWVKGE
jgi:hypothetical protein